MYNGSPQIPTLTAGNIADGDDAWLSVKGEGVEVGTYSASAMLSGNDAGKYSLPAEDAGVSFVITQSGTVFEGGVKAYLGTKETTDVQYGDTITIKVSPRATGNAPDSSEPPSVSVKPTNGQVTFFAGGQKLNEAVNTDENGVYTLTYDTVSYTHLDVYKRQLYTSAGKLRVIFTGQGSSRIDAYDPVGLCSCHGSFIKRFVNFSRF